MPITRLRRTKQTTNDVHMVKIKEITIAKKASRPAECRCTSENG